QYLPGFFYTLSSKACRTPCLQDNHPGQFQEVLRLLCAAVRTIPSGGKSQLCRIHSLSFSGVYGDCCSRTAYSNRRHRQEPYGRSGEVPFVGEREVERGERKTGEGSGKWEVGSGKWEDQRLGSIVRIGRMIVGGRRTDVRCRRMDDE